ncbi:hypothetical protein SCOR_20330 [Sulfidibacter corallicola]|uniref:TIGR02646 family protein n=1 Tax=Sulfidibacter corallicola TaxID=2818388 RepID=A0A8A4TVN8_SULCO|nr:hypothetical protein [Sulfidibacter corallicola]QTD53211.1 hypothetical protein J3U87_12205 [Sulfidibacter corallicola]
MRHVPIDDLLNTIFACQDGKAAKIRLAKAHKHLTEISAKKRKDYVEKNGPAKWSPLKDLFTAELGNKCWYTEAELVGASLTIDHFRPKCDYWFLTFKADNYRLACPFANSPKHNPEHGCSGGKGDHFPLLDPSKKATGIRSIVHERPIILDPCNEDDCRLIAFLPDGRPVIHPDSANDPIAQKRVEESKILLNLDHPDFNSKREQLHDEIANYVSFFEALPRGSAERKAIRDRLAQKIASCAPFSLAARQYLGAHRHLDWVADLLESNPA